jgi:hypothetical protein
MAQVHKDKGTLGFLMYHEHPDWWSNNDGYNFGPYNFGPMIIKCTKTPDRILRIEVSPLFERTVSFECPIEEEAVKDGGIRVHINWGKPTVNLFLAAKLVQSVNIDTKASE